MQFEGTFATGTTRYSTKCWQITTKRLWHMWSGSALQSECLSICGRQWSTSWFFTTFPSITSVSHIKILHLHCYMSGFIFCVYFSGIYPYLNSQAIKKRNRNSAISISCEMSMHVLELVFELMVFLLSNNPSAFNLLWSVYQFEFAVKSLCQAMATETRRKWLQLTGIIISSY